MSALVERIIAARDQLKRRERDVFLPAVFDVMADAANAIVGYEALLKAESAARLDLSMLAADACGGQDVLRGLLVEAREFVTDALEAHEHSDGRDLLNRIDAALGNTAGEA